MHHQKSDGLSGSISTSTDNRDTKALGHTLFSVPEERELLVQRRAEVELFKVFTSGSYDHYLSDISTLRGIDRGGDQAFTYSLSSVVFMHDERADLRDLWTVHLKYGAAYDLSIIIRHPGCINKLNIVLMATREQGPEVILHKFKDSRDIL
jgi:hypothetical protein